MGLGATRFRVGDLVGVAWLFSSSVYVPTVDARMRTSATSPRFTGYDMDGGYAGYIVAPEAVIYSLHRVFPRIKRYHF